MRIITLILFILFSQILPAQTKDTAIVIKDSSTIVNKNIPEQSHHSPKKATLMSAILPGAGQVYNKQYWKLSLIYGGMGALGYFIHDNNKVYKDYLQQWKYATDGDSNTNVRPELAHASPDALHNAFSSYRKFRDQCIIGFALLYAANIIDANVYAHLYYFNVDDISLHFTPTYNMTTLSFVPSFTLRYKIK